MLSDWFKWLIWSPLMSSSENQNVKVFRNITKTPSQEKKILEAVRKKQKLLANNNNSVLSSTETMEEKK